MSTSKQEFLKSFDLLPDVEKLDVASEIIRRTFAHNRTIEFDEAQLASPYADFANEDQVLAEEGMEDYERGLLVDDGGHCSS